MKILHTADWHIGSFKGPVESDGTNLRMQDTVYCLEEMVETANEEKPDLVCISGDIFHQEQVGPVRYSGEMIAALNIIEELAGIAKFVVVLKGTTNHDGSKKSQFSVLERALKHNHKVAVVTTPQVIATPIADIACIPGFDKQDFRAKFPGISADQENLIWTENIHSLVAGLRAQCSENVPAILMGHYTVPGCNTESGQTSFFSNFEPVIPREALQTADFDAVLLGHIHRPQKLPGLRNVFYSGAINALNFNDEGQERGFYIHEIRPAKSETGFEIYKSEFHTTSYRHFCTIEWEPDDVAAYIDAPELTLSDTGVADMVPGCIVRVKYTCSEALKKALNVPKLIENLYECGAFYVADIEAEQTLEIANRGLLAEESDPLANLKKWLDEKCYTEPDKIIELAEPIIATALAAAPTAQFHGIFKPVSISVKNYRNYREESFDFSDISFCTINGQNGAGKSSLFMDAIADCLFEETREGDNKSWIRGTEDARSGSIEFVFDIGDKRFRVTRTRTKSGRPTLNLSQKDESGEWINLSKERVIDTQKEIEKVLGMDSMTFKSCALIMQDQYGLFLQAKKDERMAILSNLLGLGIYGVMEADARKCLGDSKRQLADLKEQERMMIAMRDSKGNPESELNEIAVSIASAKAEKAKLENRKSELEHKKLVCEATEKEIGVEYGKLVAVNNRILSAEKDKKETSETILKLEAVLRDEATLVEFAKKAEEADRTARELAGSVAKLDAAERELASLRKQIDSYKKSISGAEIIISKKKRMVEGISSRIDSDGIEEGLKALESARAELAEMEERKDKYIQFQIGSRNRMTNIDGVITDLNLRIAQISQTYDDAKRQCDIVKDSGCAVPESASCKFLSDAKTKIAQLPEIEAKLASLQLALEEAKAEKEARLNAITAEVSNIGYDEDAYKQLQMQVQYLRNWEKQRNTNISDNLAISALRAEIDAKEEIIANYTEIVSEAKLSALELTEIVSSLTETVEKYNSACVTYERYKPYIQQLANVPAYKASLQAAKATAEKAEASLQEAESEKECINARIASLQLDLKMNQVSVKDIAVIAAAVKACEADLAKYNIAKGGAEQRLKDLREIEQQMKDVKSNIQKAADEAARYEILKVAFSQDGVPHQIVRNIIPHITDTCNSILGSMTNGSMGVEFVLEKQTRGKDGDKATLDVLINEFGKTTLPYASKSGGEKVKASLAVILALAEIKTSAAGVRLGMLFIDEPPFLDGDGVQAYVDALETIRNRYPDVKVMAITHDEAMKARFDQSVEVIKTNEGSIVIR